MIKTADESVRIYGVSTIELFVQNEANLINGYTEISPLFVQIWTNMDELLTKVIQHKAIHNVVATIYIAKLSLIALSCENVTRRLNVKNFIAKVHLHPENTSHKMHLHTAGTLIIPREKQTS